MGADGSDIFKRRSGHTHERLADGQHDFAHHECVFRADQGIHIVHNRAAQGVLLGDHSIVRFARQQIRNGVVHRFFRIQRFAVLKEKLCSLLGVGARRAKIADVRRRG